MSEHDDRPPPRAPLPLYELEPAHVRPAAEPRPSRPWLNILLFVVTIVINAIARLLIWRVTRGAEGMVRE